MRHGNLMNLIRCLAIAESASLRSIAVTPEVETLEGRDPKDATGIESKIANEGKDSAFPGRIAPPGNAG